MQTLKKFAAALGAAKLLLKQHFVRHNIWPLHSKFASYAYVIIHLVLTPCHSLSVSGYTKHVSQLHKFDFDQFMKIFSHKKDWFSYYNFQAMDFKNTPFILFSLRKANHLQHWYEQTGYIGLQGYKSHLVVYPPSLKTLPCHSPLCSCMSL